MCLLQQATTRVALVSWARVAPSLLRVVEQPTIKAVDSVVHGLVDRMLDRQPSLHLGHLLQAQLALLLERVGSPLAANNAQYLKSYLSFSGNRLKVCALGAATWAASACRDAIEQLQAVICQTALQLAVELLDKLLLEVLVAEGVHQQLVEPLHLRALAA